MFRFADSTTTAKYAVLNACCVAKMPTGSALGVTGVKTLTAPVPLLAALIISMIVPTMATAQTTDSDVIRRTNGDIVLRNYPPASLKRGEQGTVGVDVTTDKQGRIRACRVEKSSGFPMLDEATCDLLISHLKGNPFLAPNGGGVLKRQKGQIVWALPADYKGPIAKPAKVIASAQDASDLNKKICRVQTRTGSLVASQRVCLTRGEWQRQINSAQEETQSMRPRFSPGN